MFEGDEGVANGGAGTPTGLGIPTGGGAALGALPDLVDEPLGLQTILLGNGKVAVARNDNDFVVAEFGDVGPVPQLLPFHRSEADDVLGIDNHIPVPRPFEQGYHLHAKTHFRRPEALKNIPGK